MLFERSNLYILKELWDFSYGLEWVYPILASFTTMLKQVTSNANWPFKGYCFSCCCCWLSDLCLIVQTAKGAIVNPKLTWHFSAPSSYYLQNNQSCVLHFAAMMFWMRDSKFGFCHFCLKKLCQEDTNINGKFSFCNRLAWCGIYISIIYLYILTASIIM